MKITTMLGDVLRSLLRPNSTQQYPAERQPDPERLRGKLVWNGEKCTGCALCVKECPALAIELITLDKAAKRFVMRYHIDRCTFCAQCVENCRFGCLQMSNTDWELAAADKSAFTVYYGKEHDIEMARSAQAASTKPEPAEG